MPKHSALVPKDEKMRTFYKINLFQLIQNMKTIMEGTKSSKNQITNNWGALQSSYTGRWK